SSKWPPAGFDVDKTQLERLPPVRGLRIMPPTNFPPGSIRTLREGRGVYAVTEIVFCGGSVQRHCICADRHINANRTCHGHDRRRGGESCGDGRSDQHQLHVAYGYERRGTVPRAVVTARCVSSDIRIPGVQEECAR